MILPHDRSQFFPLPGSFALIAISHKAELLLGVAL